MSRNIGDTGCMFCWGKVVLVEPPRAVTREDTRGYADEYAGMIVAHAECEDCHGKYLAWVDESQRARYRRHLDSRDTELGFHDLSFRASFNDEPAPEDLYTVDPRIARARRLKIEHDELMDDAATLPLEARARKALGLEPHPLGRWESYRG